MTQRHDALPGLAHVATCSFLASRISPSLQFWLALGGGVALARAGERHGVKAGYSASLAAVTQTVAMIGPARVNGPLTQALNAPVVGSMLGRGRSFTATTLACLAIRLVHYVILNVVFVLIVVGGLDEFVATYDKVAGFLRILPKGQTAALVLTIIFNIGWAIFYSVVQVLAYRRALSRWPVEAPAAPATLPAEGDADDVAEILEPAARRHLPAGPVVTVAAAVCVLLLASTAWPVLGGVAAGLALAVVVARTFEASVWRLGFALAALLAFSAMFPAIIGAVDLDDATQRAIRIVLLVLVATWARAAAGTTGVRRIARKTLAAFRLRTAAALTDALDSDDRLLPAGRALVKELEQVETKPVPMADALTRWVAGESSAYAAPPLEPLEPVDPIDPIAGDLARDPA